MVGVRAWIIVMLFRALCDIDQRGRRQLGGARHNLQLIIVFLSIGRNSLDPRQVFHFPRIDSKSPPDVEGSPNDLPPYRRVSRTTGPCVNQSVSTLFFSHFLGAHSHTHTHTSRISSLSPSPRPSVGSRTTSAADLSVSGYLPDICHLRTVYSELTCRARYIEDVYTPVIIISTCCTYPDASNAVPATLFLVRAHVRQLETAPEEKQLEDCAFSLHGGKRQTIEIEEQGGDRRNGEPDGGQ